MNLILYQQHAGHFDFRRVEPNVVRSAATGRAALDFRMNALHPMA